eukprot:TRINITY_DN3847_c0_g1_i5.p1 TRINITY_DN3847_c0_g1~~TRINITY_DN3847_c0_g1_i5.p1  ORF type:complete len:178 (+),score=43.01 TRINITY_DN3847_c0_g1_i5:357-890(+)
MMTSFLNLQISYVIQEPEKPGSLDAKKAAQLGAKGKLLGMLKAGKDVTLENGSVIKASDVLSAPQPGRKVVLLGDTCDSTQIMEAANNCDVLVHEATYDASLEQKAIEGGHSTSKMAGQFASKIHAKKLFLTHFSMRYTTTREPGDLGVAELQKEAQAEAPHTVVIAADDLTEYPLS